MLMEDMKNTRKRKKQVKDEPIEFEMEDMNNSSELNSEVKEEPFGFGFSPNILSTSTIHQNESKISFSKKPFQCDQCQSSFRFRASFDYHKDTIHSAPKIETEALKNKFQCEICHEVLKDQAGLTKHIRKHKRNNNASRDECDETLMCLYADCGVSLSSKQAVYMHLNDHHDEESLYFISSETHTKCRIVKSEKCYGCVGCSLSYKSIRSLRHHYTEHASHLKPTQKKTFACSHCSKVYYTRSGLRYHNKQPCWSRSGNDRNSAAHVFACTQCEKKFRSRPGKRYHERTAHGVGRPLLEDGSIQPLTYPCTKCNKVYRSRPGLVYHKKHEHTGETTKSSLFLKSAWPSTCEICGLTFREPTLLELHQSHEHRHKPLPDRYSHVRLVPGDRPYGCRLCDKTYTQMMGLDIHHSVHRGSYVCDQCGRDFFNQNSFNYHRSACRTARNAKQSKYNKPLECSSCHQQFRTQSHLKQHQACHTLSLAFSCEFCNRQFSCHQSLKQHVLLHDPQLAHRLRAVSRLQFKQRYSKEKYSCPICKKKFSSRAFLRSHLLIHTRGRPYKCKSCDQGFQTQTYALVHARLHSGEKPHSCAMCSKTFRFKSTANWHSARHSNQEDLEYECKACRRFFANSSRYQKHMRLHRSDHLFRCIQCGKRFKTAKMYKNHKDRHSGNYKCMMCWRSFSSQALRHSHVRLHHCNVSAQNLVKTGLACFQCPRTFLCKALLNAHKALHAAGFGYECQGCRKVFHNYNSYHICCARNVNTKPSLPLTRITPIIHPFAGESCAQNSSAILGTPDLLNHTLDLSNHYAAAANTLEQTHNLHHQHQQHQVLTASAVEPYHPHHHHQHHHQQHHHHQQQQQHSHHHHHHHQVTAPYTNNTMDNRSNAIEILNITPYVESKELLDLDTKQQHQVLYATPITDFGAGAAANGMASGESLVNHHHYSKTNIDSLNHNVTNHMAQNR